jgi:hypoxanthine phosphoribosyltransferase
MVGKDVEELVSQKEISKRVVELAGQIERDFDDGDMVAVGVLKGSFIFMADLVRAIKRPLACDFIRVSSYENDVDTGAIRLEFDMTQPVHDKNVLLVEDIVDSGKTLRFLINHLKAKKPRQLKVASLLYKEMGTNSRGLVDYVGFEVPRRYVIGYGLDSMGLYRSLPYVGAFK